LSEGVATIKKMKCKASAATRARRTSTALAQDREKKGMRSHVNCLVAFVGNQ